MKKFTLLFLCLITFIICSGFTVKDSSWTKIYTGNRKEQMDKGISCTYKPAQEKIGNLKFISFSADTTNFQVNANFDFGTNIQLIIAHSDTPNSNSNRAAVDGTNVITMQNFNIGTNICPANIYIYSYKGMYISSYDDVTQETDGPFDVYDIRTTTNSTGNVAHYVSQGSVSGWDYREDHIDTDGNVIDNNSGEVQDPVVEGNENTIQEEDYYYADMDCYGLLGDPNDANFPAYWVQLALSIMRYAAIIALVGLSISDFVKAIVSQNQDALKKAITTTGKRFIFAILVFFAPIVVEFIMNLFGVYGTCAL